MTVKELKETIEYKKLIEGLNSNKQSYKEIIKAYSIKDKTIRIFKDELDYDVLLIFIADHKNKFNSFVDGYEGLVYRIFTEDLEYNNLILDMSYLEGRLVLDYNEIQKSKTINLGNIKTNTINFKPLHNPIENIDRHNSECYSPPSILKILIK